jgi:hypothetical protein
MLFFLLLSTTHSKLCSDLQRSDFSESLTTCINTLDKSSCTEAIKDLDEKFSSCIKSAPVLTFRQKLYDFNTGFFYGLQVDPTSPSECVVSLIQLKKRWEIVFNGLTMPKFSTPVMFLFNFNSFISELDSFYGLCTLSTIYDIFHPETFPLFLNSILIKWLAEKDKVKATIKAINKSLNSSDFVSAGVNSGKLFTYLTGYKIDS